MKNVRFTVMFAMLIMAVTTIKGVEPVKDPLNGERKVAIGVRLKVMQTNQYAGFIGGISANCHGGESELCKWEIGICGGNLVTIKNSTIYHHDIYWYLDPSFSGYKIGARHKLDSLSYFEIITLKNGNIALKSHLKNGKYISLSFNKSMGIYMFDAINDKVEDACQMQIEPYRYVTLGEPTHWYTTDIRPILTLCEPPKHIDYTLNADGEKEDLNVSRSSGFYSLFKDKSEKEISSSNTSTSDVNFAVEVSGGVSADKGLPILKDIKAEVSASASYMYKNHEEDINKNFKSVTTEEELKAVNGDFLVFNKSTIHIWSYPILGETQVETTEGKKGQLYYQVVVPEPDADNPHYLSGSVSEWYQPTHQNGNVFSYPWTQEQIRKFEITDTLNILSNPKTIATDNNEMSYYIEWNEATEREKSVNTSHKLAEESSIGVSFPVYDFGLSSKVKTSLDKSWESLSISNTKLTQSKGITIFKGPLSGAPFYAYEVHPLIYTKGKDKMPGVEAKMPMGAITLSYLVKFPDDFTSYLWWQKGYAGKPDIALNMPYQWRMTDETGNSWKFDSKSINFSMMKGLFVETKLGKRFFYSIEEGEPINVKFRVYNYSFCKAKNVLVRLEAQKSTDGKEWGKRFVVGVDTILTLQGFGNLDSHNNWEYASVTFDTKGKAGDYYRFWVVANPDNKIKELDDHGYKQKYSNNEGFFSIPLTIVAKPKDELKENSALFTKNYTATISPIEFSNINPTQGEIVSISTWVSVSGADVQPMIIYFYENTLDQKRKLFDMEVIPFIKNGGKYYVQIPYSTLGKSGKNQITVETQLQESVSNENAVLNVK